MLVHHKLKLFYGSVFDASVVTTYVTAAVDHRLGEKVLPVVSSCFDGRERTMLVVVGCASQVSTNPTLRLPHACALGPALEFPASQLRESRHRGCP